MMVGQVISHFRILEKLGEGGMGVVYRAHDVQLERPVALKFPSAEHAGVQESARRFVREARAASSLTHPNVITVYEIGEHEGRMYIATELVEGKTLRELIRPEGLGVDFTLECAAQIVQGLRAAHAKGIIHRDIKPENLMLASDGRVKIMDFGLAHTIGVDERITSSGAVLGTALYMSPEQINGQAVDHRTDIYSFGAVLYEMLSGRPIFAGEYQVAILYSIVSADPVPLEELTVDVPPRLCRLVARCLQKSPLDRYQSCEELALEIGELRRHTASSPASPPRVLQRVPLSIPPEVEQRRPVIGRMDQLRSFAVLLTKLESGRGRTLFVRGELGIGKTYMVAAAAYLARERGMSVLWGRCLFQEAGLPYHPIAMALRNSFHGSGDDILHLLSHRAAHLGMSIAGRLASLRSFLKLSTESVALQNKEQLWDAILLVLRLLTADRPIVFVIDDMQWADHESIGLFSFLARNISDIPLLLVGIGRQEPGVDEPALSRSPVSESIRQLKLEECADEIEIHRFSESETADLLQQALDARETDPRIVSYLHSITEGNPLFARELVALMKESGAVAFEGGQWRMATATRHVQVPRRIHEVLSRRLARLTTEQREMLEIASCDGNQFNSDTVAACLQIDRLTLLRRLQSFEKEHALIRHEKSGYRFDTPLIRQILYDGILPELREEYHRLIAEWLIVRSGSDSALASRIAHHLRSSGQESTALAYLLKAAEHARSLYANDEALDLYRQAQEVLVHQTAGLPAESLRVAEGLGDVALASGRAQEAAEQYQAMLRLARDLSDRFKQVESLRKWANSLRILGDIPYALELATEGLQLARSIAAPGLQIESLNSLAFIHAARGEYERTTALSEEALRLAHQHSDDRNAAISLSNLGFAFMHTGAYRTAAERLEEARSLQEFIGDRKGLGLTLNYLALVNHRLARYEVALENARASLEIKKSIADVATIPGVLNILGDLFRDIGETSTARDYHTRSLELARQQNNRGSQCDNLRDLGADSLIQGQTEQARQFLEQVLALARAHGLAWYETRSNITFAEFYLKTGDLASAEPSAVRGVEMARALKAQELIVEALWKMGLVFHRTGRHHQASEALREAMQIAESAGHETFLWQIGKDAVVVFASAGEAEEAASVYHKTRELVQRIAEGLADDAARRNFLQWTGMHDQALSPPQKSQESP